MKQARQIFRDALLLTAAAFLMKTAGVAFGVAVSRRAGAEAMGLFSLIAGVYGFALTLATSGIQLGVTRVVTETVSRGNPERVGAILRRAVFYALLCGSLAALLLLSGASLIGTRFLHDVRTGRTAPPVRADPAAHLLFFGCLRLLCGSPALPQERGGADSGAGSQIRADRSSADPYEPGQCRAHLQSSGTGRCGGGGRLLSGWTCHFSLRPQTGQHADCSRNPPPPNSVTF